MISGFIHPSGCYLAQDSERGLWVRGAGAAPGAANCTHSVEYLGLSRVLRCINTWCVQPNSCTTLTAASIQQWGTCKLWVIHQLLIRISSALVAAVSVVEYSVNVSASHTHTLCLHLSPKNKNIYSTRVCHRWEQGVQNWKKPIKAKEWILSEQQCNSRGNSRMSKTGSGVTLVQTRGHYIVISQFSPWLWLSTHVLAVCAQMFVLVKTAHRPLKGSYMIHYWRAMCAGHSSAAVQPGKTI